jgi:hypothetical protein
MPHQVLLQTDNTRDQGAGFHGGETAQNGKGIAMKITQDIVRRLLDYDPDTGLLRWKRRDRSLFGSDRAFNTWNTRFAGKEAGYQISNENKYLYIGIFGRAFLAHRIIFLWMTGDWPSEEIDHVNRDRIDNRWLNLRAASRLQNSKNQPMRVNNKSGHTGVHWLKREGLWRAQINVDTKVLTLGYSADLSRMVRLRKAAEVLFDFDPTHGAAR